MNIHKAFHITSSGLPGYDEIMDRQRENWEMERERRSELIAQKKKEYFEDVGTFFEFIQNIEISNKDSFIFEDMHKKMQRGWGKRVGLHLYDLFNEYCERLAAKEIDDELRRQGL